RREPRHDHIDLEPNQFGCQFRKAAHLSFVRSELEANVLPFAITKIPQILPKQLPEFLPAERGTNQNANGWHPGLLRARSHPPHDRHASNQFEELASSHVALPRSEQTRCYTSRRLLITLIEHLCA